MDVIRSILIPGFDPKMISSPPKTIELIILFKNYISIYPSIYIADEYGKVIRKNWGKSKRMTGELMVRKHV